MPPAVRSVKLTRIEGARRVGRDDVAAAEEPLAVRLDGRPFAVIMRTPGADRELVAGFLLSEGVIAAADELADIEEGLDRGTADRGDVVNVALRGRDAAALLAGRRQVVASSSCGMCGRPTLESLNITAGPLAAVWRVAPPLVAHLPARLRERQAIFGETGGLHAAGLFDLAGECVAMAEDVGRHNAVDKVVGRMLLERRLPLDRHLLFVSGRTSFEIVQKGLLAGIALVGAVSAPSSLAIDLAAEAGMTLLGFVRDGGFNIYTHPERIGGSADRGQARV